MSDRRCAEHDVELDVDAIRGWVCPVCDDQTEAAMWPYVVTALVILLALFAWAVLRPSSHFGLTLLVAAEQLVHLVRAHLNAAKDYRQQFLVDARVLRRVDDFVQQLLGMRFTVSGVSTIVASGTPALLVRQSQRAGG